MTSIELLKVILQLVKISPSFNLDNDFDLDDGLETASCRQTGHSFETFKSFLEIKNQDSNVYLEPSV